MRLTFVIALLNVAVEQPPGIVPDGNKMISVDSGNGDSRALRTLATGYNSGTLYCSVLAHNLNSSLRYLGLSLYENGTEKTLLGQGSGYPVWTLNKLLTNGVSSVTVYSTVSSSDMALLVLKVEFNASAYDSTYEQLTFWVNPDLSQPESVTSAVGGQSYSSDRDYGTINRIRIGGGATSGDNVASLLYMDEIRVSTVSPFAPPALQISVLDSEALLAWPANGWTLQKSSTLGNELWDDVIGTESLTATNLPITLPVEFFRLKQE